MPLCTPYSTVEFKTQEQESTAMSAITRTRRPKWRPAFPPPPSPKIINLPRRTRRKQPRISISKLPISSRAGENCKGKLENLFDEEREFVKGVPVVLLNSSQRRERVEVVEKGEVEGGGGFAEEKWRFQADILRAECNYLRMERKYALKKLERNRVKMERTLRSAVHNLALGRKKIYEGENMEVVLEEEIKDLAEKLEELQRSSGVKHLELPRKCLNFDRKASRLQQRLEKIGGLSDDKCIRGTAESNVGEIEKDSYFCSGCKAQNSCIDNLQVEKLETNLDGLSKGMLDRMEAEYGSILSTTANTSVASSASSSKQIELPNQVPMSHEENQCSGRCKALVKRIVEQVRAETEQWSQMQQMLAQLRAEMEELQTSRDFWENQALASTSEIQCLTSCVGEWREKAISFEKKAIELEKQVCSMKEELENTRKEHSKSSDDSTPEKFASPISLRKQIEKEKRVLICHVKGSREEKPSNIEEQEDKGMKEVEPISLGKQLAREKRILVCRLKENRQLADDKKISSRKQHEILSKERAGRNRRKANACNEDVLATPMTRLPFREIGNSSSPIVRHNTNAIFPLHCLEPLKS